MTQPQKTEMQQALHRQNRMLARYKKSKFLIIEDSADARGMLRGMLKDLSAVDIDLATNGEDAIEHLFRHSYDVVLCDYNLGKGKDGQQILEEGRYSGFLKNSAIFIMVTAETSVEMVMGALEYQPDSYISKPFTRNELKTRLERTMHVKVEYNDIELAFHAKNYQKTILLCEQKIRKDKRGAMRAHRIQAECFMAIEAFEKALKVYTAISRERGLPWAKIGKGKALFYLNRHPEAEGIFQELIVEQPNVIESYDWLARILAADKKYKAAQATLMEATVRSPKAVLRQMELARLAMFNNSYLIAEKAFRKAIVLGSHSCYNSPENYLQYVRSLLVKIDLSKSKLSSDAFQEARLFLKRMRKEFSKDPIVLVRSTWLESLVCSGYGALDERDELLKKATGVYDAFEEKLQISFADEYVQTLCSQGLMAEAEKFTTEFVAEFDHPLLNERLLQRLEEGKERLVAERISEEAINLYSRGALVEAYTKFSEAASKQGASTNILLRAVSTCLELAEKRHLNTDEWRINCQVFLTRLAGLDEYDHRYQQYEELKQRYGAL
jgi:CheY-like chemotaxis protein